MFLTTEYRKLFDSYCEKAFVDEDEIEIEHDAERVEKLFQNSHRVIMFLERLPDHLFIYEDYTVVMVYADRSVYIATDDEPDDILIHSTTPGSVRNILRLKAITELPADILNLIRKG